MTGPARCSRAQQHWRRHRNRRRAQLVAYIGYHMCAIVGVVFIIGIVLRWWP